MRVAVVRNHDNTAVINRFGQPRTEFDDRETVESVMAARCKRAATRRCCAKAHTNGY